MRSKGAASPTSHQNHWTVSFIQAQAGEALTSARAVMPVSVPCLYYVLYPLKQLGQSIMGSLYDFNHRPENWDIKHWDGPCTKAQKEQDIAKGRWSGPYGHHVLQLAYTLAFTCLLCVDEVMKIKAPNIKLLDDETIELTLPFCKTSQFGGRVKLLLVLCLLSATLPEIQPFVLCGFPSAMAHLCPVCAYSDWVKATKNQWRVCVSKARCRWPAIIRPQCCNGEYM